MNSPLHADKVLWLQFSTDAMLASYKSRLAVPATRVGGLFIEIISMFSNMPDGDIYSRNAIGGKRDRFRPS